MNWKSQVLILFLLVISPTTLSFIFGRHVVSSNTDLWRSAEYSLAQIVTEPFEMANKILQDVQDANDDLLHQFEKILNTLKGVPDIINENNKLQTHLDSIGFAFKNAVEKKININANKREDQRTYENFRNKLEGVIDYDISEIYRMLLNDTATSYLKRFLIEGVELHDNVCATGMSQLQLLDSLLTKLKLATIQYYLTKRMMYEFIQPYCKNLCEFDMIKENLMKLVQIKYNKAIFRFKPIMANASQEIWRCDADKVTRYENKLGSPYFELMAFTKYVFNDGIFESLISDDWPRCSEITKVDECKSTLNDHGKYCQNTRKCPNKLIGCKNLHENHVQKTRVCLNDDKSALNRYKSFVPENKVEKFACPGGTVKEIADVKVGWGSASRPISSIKSWHHFCGCLCEEKYYYISTAPMYADYHDNKVVIGAKLVIVNDTIYVQIKQGALINNGLIDENTLEWKPIKKNEQQRVKITWEGVRSIDLTSTKLGKEHSVIGLSFVQSKSNSTRISLITYACQFRFDIGRNLCPDNASLTTHYKESPERELILKDMNVPVDSSEPNLPDSNDDQFLSFTITGEKEDGAQTTIPFIDTQELVTNPPVPLRGVGLIHRGQPGFGGFLALKIYTYNVTHHISDLLQEMNILGI